MLFFLRHVSSSSPRPVCVRRGPEALLTVLVGLLIAGAFGAEPAAGQDRYASSVVDRTLATGGASSTWLMTLETTLPKLNRVISLHLDAMTVEEALLEVGKLSDLGLVYGRQPALSRQRAAIDLEQVTVLEAFYEVLRGTDLGLKLSPSGHIIIVNRAGLSAYDGDTFDPALLHQVAGTVLSSEDGQPLPGVNVRVLGTNTGTATGPDGTYALNAPTPNDTLVFSFVGFVTQEVPINGRAEVNALMEVDTQVLEDVVVVGYGEKTRALLTESIGTVSADEITRVPVASPDQALQGRISGVQVTSISGMPGAPAAVRIRGVGTVGNTQPLFVIDGIPVGRGEAGLGTGSLNPLATVNPADIESISVLKDASAAAVYGVRAANGVVLITTKRGRPGKPTVNFDSYVGVQRLPDLWDMNGTTDYVALTQDAYDAYNTQNALTPGDESYLVLHPDLQSGSSYLGINNEGVWTRSVTQDNAPIQNYNLSISGANDNLNYFVSGGYFAQESVVDKWDLQRFTFRANSDYEIIPRLRIGESFTISHRELLRGYNAGGDGFLLRNAATMPPFFRLYDSDNSIPGNRYGFDGNLDVAGLTVANPFGINQLLEQHDRSTRMLGNIYAELDLIQGLTFRSVASVDLILGRNDNWSPGWTGEELGLDRPNDGYGDSRSESVTEVYTNTLTYDNQFGGHSVNILTGLELQRLRGTTLSGNANQFLSASPAFYTVVKNGTADINIGGGASESAFVGYIGRLSYDYQRRYLLTATVRRDGSSRFSPEDNRRWGTFPSVSAAWRLSEESFFNIPAVSELKLRGSWGQLGNDQTTAFPHIFRVSVTPDYGLGGNTTVQAPVPINFVNKDVTWETVETIDVGVDVGFFDDRLSLLATYYRRTTQDFLITIPIPSITGFTGAPVNAGEVLNTGFEFEIGYATAIGPDLSIDIAANLTTVDNELTALRPGIEEFLETGQYRTAVGFPIGYFYGYRTGGLYQTPDEAAQALPDASSPDGPRAGDVRFVDTNGPATEEAPPGQQFSGVPDGMIDANDRTYLGKTIPDAYYGLNLSAAYKGLDLSLFFQGVAGVELYNEFRFQAEGGGLNGGGRNQLTSTQDRWTGPGTSDDIPRAVANDPNDNDRFSDRWVENGSYFRLKNVQLGYTLPASILPPGAALARLYVAATNLLTLTPYSGLDPEVMTFNSNGSQIGQDVSVGNPPSGGSGTDQGNIPQTRTFQVGVQLRF